MATTGTTYRTNATVGRVATGRSIEVGFGGAGGKGVMVEMGWLSGGGEAEWPPATDAKRMIVHPPRLGRLRSWNQRSRAWAISRFIRSWTSARSGLSRSACSSAW